MMGISVAEIAAELRAGRRAVLHSVHLSPTEGELLMALLPLGDVTGRETVRQRIRSAEVDRELERRNPSVRCTAKSGLDVGEPST